MSIKLVEIIKGLLIKQDGVLNPAKIEILPGGTAGTKTTIQTAQTSDAIITLPAVTSTLASTADVTSSSGAVNDLLDDHIADPSAAHAASAISTTSSNVQSDLNTISSTLTDLDSRLDTIESAVISDPVTKTYVDAADAGLASDISDLTSVVNTKLPLAGGTMTGNIEIGTNKITSGADGIDFADSAVRTYSELGGEITVDSNVVIDANTIQVIGNNFDSFVDLDLNAIAKVKNSIDPTSAQDLTTKNYVDSLLNNMAVSNWSRGIAAEDNPWGAIAYGNSRYVAVAPAGTNRVMYSYNGLEYWVTATVPANAWTDVCYGNGLFVAVAQSSTAGQRIITSSSGATWTQRTAPAGLAWIAITYGNGTFVAVSASVGTANAMTSTDGITWTQQTTFATSHTLSDVTYGNGLFVAVGTNNTSGAPLILTSPDGITWTQRTHPGVSGGYTNTIAFGNGIFVAANTSTEIECIRSTDGITWTAHAGGLYETFGMTYGRGLFVAVGPAVGSNQSVATSPDGINWTYIPSLSGNWNDIVYDGKGFIAIGSSSGVNNKIMYSLRF